MSISSYTQELMCLMGQHLVFKEAEQVINDLTGAGVDAKQIERICHHYGHCLEQEDLENIKTKGCEQISPKESEKLNYVSVDGSMYLTREDHWKEIKLGRIYKQQDLIKTSKSRSVLMSSIYEAYLGNSKGFLPKMEYHIEKLMRYHTFRNRGLLIGSGAIESAHKDVLQRRLKLSGQRWTKSGLNQMAQLRVAYKSGKWDRIKRLCELKKTA